RRDITEPFALVPGTSTISVPTGPGLGVSVDADALAELGARIDEVWASGTGAATGPTTST
ncbi:MAG: hypothetical protein ACKOAZ_00590, partial [Ilumatobacteraceae bacterium]